jgi:hypothetical protein
VLFKCLCFSVIWRGEEGYISKQNFNGSNTVNTLNLVERGYRRA